MRARAVVSALAVALVACSGAGGDQTSSAAGGSPGSGTGTSRSRARSLPTGTALVLQSEQAINSNANHVGDAVSARFVSPAMSGNDTVIPVGATLHGTVTALHKSTSAGAPGQLELAFTEVRIGSTSRPISVQVTSVATNLANPGVTTEDAVKVAAGAAAGAIAGRVIGGDKTGARVGAGAGAAAGVVYANRTRDRDIIMSSGAAINAVTVGTFALR